MNNIKLVCIGLLALNMGCSHSDKRAVDRKDSTDREQATTALKETGIPKIGDPQLVVPGRQMGKISIGQDMEEVFKLLGKPDDGDAAMGKAWSIWKLKDGEGGSDNGEMAIYSTYKDSTMSSKVVKQVMVNTGGYATKNGLQNNADLGHIIQGLPSLKQVSMYVDDAKKDTLYVYDSKEEGLSFDVKRTNDQYFTRAMTIHPKHESVSNTYLTIHPGWRKVQ